MFILIESQQEIAHAQRKLEATLKRDLHKTVSKDIGYPGGREHDARVRTDLQFWCWSSDFDGADVPNPRRLNWFGLFNESGGLAITVEMNIAYQGRNDQVAGFFGRDNRSGMTYLFHSGRVGGGTKGVGKEALLAWGDLELHEVADASGGIREGVLVMPVEGVGATQSAIRYIKTIVGFKAAVREGEIARPSFQRKLKRWGEFYSEARGRRKGRRSSKIDYVSRHGEVVDAIFDWRLAKGLPSGSKLVKDVLIDMGILIGKNLAEVYEVKTSASRSDVYTAIGQLLIHGAKENCRRVIVLPDDEPVAEDLRVGLARLNIELVRFVLSADTATIVVE